MWQWIQNNYIELVGAALALLYLVLEVKEKWTMWWVGIFSSAFYVFIFFQSKVYAQMALNGYFFLMNIYGLYYWRIAPKKDDKELKTSHINTRTACLIALLSGVLWLAIAWSLTTFTDSQVPYSDALLAALSLSATWLVARKVLECWILWIFVNTYSVALYFYLDLYPTALLYMVYALMSVVGYFQWRKTMYKALQLSNQL